MFTISIIALAVALAPVTDLFDRAAKRSGHSHKELAYITGTTPPRLSHKLRGHVSRWSVAELLVTPVDFFEAFIDELRAAKGCEKPLTAREVLDLIRPVMAAAKEDDRCEKTA